MSQNIVSTNIRFNLKNEEDRRAWEHLQRLDRKRYKSYSRTVVAAVNDFFDRQDRLADDPYLETREKEDSFLERVTDTIRQGLQSAAPVSGLLQFLSGIQPPAAAKSPNAAAEQKVTNDAALDFIDSF